MLRTALLTLAVVFPLGLAAQTCAADSVHKIDMVAPPGTVAAAVSLKTPGSVGPLLPGDQTVPGDERYVWQSIAPALVGLTILNPSHRHQGVTEFTITRAGRVLLVCSDRWAGGGNSSGDWRSQLTTRQQLLDAGWQPLDMSLSLGRPSQPADEWRSFEVFQRDCKAGESFTLRTEKYEAPRLILPAGDALAIEPPARDEDERVSPSAEAPVARTPASPPASPAPAGELQLYEGFKADVERMRTPTEVRLKDGSTMLISSDESIAAAGRVFKRVSFIGQPRAKVLELLSDPATISAYGLPARDADDAPLVYNFDTGLGGVQYTLTFKAGRCTGLKTEMGE